MRAEPKPMRAVASLADMVLEFFETEGKVSCVHDGRHDDDDDEYDPITIAETKAFWESQHQLLEDALARSSSLETRIRMDAEEALRKVREESGGVCACCCSDRAAGRCRRDCVLKDVSGRLREEGYNSALCKSKWRKSLDIPSGEHAFIDVMINSKSGKKEPVRVVIEVNFRGEFEMARANQEYNGLVSRLPEIFVGKSEKLRSLIKIMCSAAKKCMKDNKMHMGPWRKHKYMQSKWLGTFERMPSPGTVVDQAGVANRQPKLRASMLTLDLHCTTVEVV